MSSEKSLKVSYCTTCKGREHHLKQTLVANMAAEAANPNVEFVVLDYDSPDGLGEWIKENYQAEMASGRLKYAKLNDAPHFKMAHAKNLAHNLASGDILCNLDADNYLAKDYSRTLVKQFEKDPNSIITHVTLRHRDPIIQKWRAFTGQKHKNHQPGMTGRIAISKENFHALRGYDETYSAWGGDDTNLVYRARNAGLTLQRPAREDWGDLIHHSNDERLQYLSQKDKAHSRQLLEGYAAKKREGSPLMDQAKKYVGYLKGLHTPPPVANPDGSVGCGTVYENFSETPTVFAPKEMHAKKAPPHYEMNNDLGAKRKWVGDPKLQRGQDRSR